MTKAIRGPGTGIKNAAWKRFLRVGSHIGFAMLEERLLGGGPLDVRTTLLVCELARSESALRDAARTAQALASGGEDCRAQALATMLTAAAERARTSIDALEQLHAAA